MNMSMSNRKETFCYCDLRTHLKTSWTKSNPGRRFWGCASYKGGGSGCGFFAWFDPAVCQHEKDVIHDLKDEVWRLKKETKVLWCSIKIYRIIIVMLVGFYVILFKMRNVF